MTDLSNNRISSATIQPGQTELIELLKDTFGDIRWHLLVYDNAGSVYLQEVINGNNIERRHTIQVYPKTSEDGNNNIINEKMKGEVGTDDSAGTHFGVE